MLSLRASGSRLSLCLRSKQVLDALALDEVPRALASTGGPLRYLPELELMRHRLPVHGCSALATNSGMKYSIN